MGAHFVDATGVLERLRAIKTPGELAKLRQASELITDSMLTTIAWAREGTTKAEIIERLRREETGRGLHFDYCLLTLGAGHNRAPSGQAWRPGEVVSIDSGGNFDGYIGDLARMGVLGEPDAELEDLLAEIDGAQQAAFATVRAGARGGDVIAAGEAARTAGPSAAFTDFVAHGMGLISHEVPFLLTGAMTRGWTPNGRSRRAWCSRSRPRCSTRGAASSSSRTPWWSPPRAARCSATADGSGTAAGASTPFELWSRRERSRSIPFRRAFSALSQIRRELMRLLYT